jgi:hypothetical protein
MTLLASQGAIDPTIIVSAAERVHANLQVVSPQVNTGFLRKKIITAEATRIAPALADLP